MLRCSGDFVAIHVRRTDWETLFGVSTPDDEFARFVAAHSERAAYVATDNARTQAAYAQLLGARFRCYAPIDAACGALRHTSVAHAAVDLLTSVEARAFKGSRGSSFSEVVWHLRRARGHDTACDELHTSRQLRRQRWRRAKKAQGGGDHKRRAKHASAVCCGAPAMPDPTASPHAPRPSPAATVPVRRLLALAGEVDTPLCAAGVGVVLFVATAVGIAVCAARIAGRKKGP